RSAQSSTQWRTSGSSCATTGSPTASSNPTTISSTIVVRHGTSSSISLGASCPSDCANGPTGSDQWDLVLALAAIYDGATRTEAAKIGGVGLQIIRDWVLRFNARGPDGLLDGKSTGQPSKLNDTQRQAIAGMIESGPIPAVHGVVRWRLIDLAQWI